MLPRARSARTKPQPQSRFPGRIPMWKERGMCVQDRERERSTDFGLSTTKNALIQNEAAAAIQVSQENFTGKREKEREREIEREKRERKNLLHT